MANSKNNNDANPAPEENIPEAAENTEQEVQDTAESSTAEPAVTEAETAEPAGNSDELSEKLSAMEAELKSEKDKYLRLAAEYDNFRKRSMKEREALYADVRSDTILKLLPVYDNLARALKHDTADEAFKKGVEMTMTQLEQILEGLNVVPIPALGQKFDPAFHNAVMHVEDENVGDGIIVQEFQKGFKMGDKVIRFSMVVVAN